MRRKPKHFSIREVVFKTEPLFIYDCPYKQMGQWLRKAYNVDIPKEDGTESACVLHFDGPPYRVVWFQRLSDSLESRGEVAHELLHLVVRICRDKGIPIVANIQTGECGDESAAYLIDFFVREVYRHVKKKKK